MLTLRLVRRLARSSDGAADHPLGGRLGRIARWGALAAIAAAAAGVATGTPRPGVRGEGLGVTLATAAMALAGLSLVAPAPLRAGWIAGPSMVVLGLASAALAGLDPDSPGYVGAYMAVGALALRVDRPVAVAASGVVLIAVTVALTLSRTAPQASAIVSIDLGLAFVFAMATFAREQQRLVVEVRAAQEARAQAAALQERARLAREMHDVLAHSLTGLSVQLEGARLLLDRGDAETAAAQVERAQALARTGLEEARRAVGALRGDAMPGPELLATLAADFERSAGVPCRLEVVGEPAPLSSESRLALYRTAQEALTNVRKHAAATAVSLRLDWTDGAADLVITDTSPAPPDATAGALSTTGGGYGLGGLRERAELVGGTLDAGPTDSGFRVHLRLPT